MATDYTLNIVFADRQFQQLHRAGYNVCISKLVNGKYNVVWSSQTISDNNVFQWTEEYGVFVAAQFTNGLHAKPQTNTVPIAFGQTATVNAAGLMDPAVGPRTGGTFSVQNDWLPAYFGVGQKYGDNYEPIYIEQAETIQGTEDFTPATTVMVFLSKNMKAGMMFTKTQTVACPVTYNGTTTQTLSYVSNTQSPGGKSGIWIHGSPPALGQFAATSEGPKALSFAVASGQLSAPIPQTYSHERGFEPLPHAYDAFHMAELINFFVHEFKPAKKPEQPETEIKDAPV